MINKIFAILFICFLTMSCGKKSDPIYKEEGKNLNSTQNKVVL